MKPIETKADHDAALREIERLWGAAPGTVAGNRLDILVASVEQYEEVNFPIGVPDQGSTG
ncbi:MAG: hypothetical protein ABR987_22510 [Terracidiphilus sp.]